MRIAIIQFPGSNCERESLRAVRSAGMEAEEFLWNRNPDDIALFDGYFIVGGFSYEDRSRAGIIASLDPIIRGIKKEAQNGKPVLGICNGAQILAETGMVPGLPDYELGMALAINKRIKNNRVLGTGFYNAWTYITLCATPSAGAFTRLMKQGFIMRVPVAHAEGRFIIPENLLLEMKAKECAPFRYCAADGEIKFEFPINPNGAVDNLAAVTNAQGNVMAMMPHPERTADGYLIFASMRDYINSKKSLKISDSYKFTPPPLEIIPYEPSKDSCNFAVELNITDNEAATVETALARLGFSASVTRATHWEIPANNKDGIISSGELFNPRKEHIAKDAMSSNTIQLLVRYREDIIGKQKQQSLKKQLPNAEMEIKHGVLWTISLKERTTAVLIKKILDTHIFFNPYSELCYHYYSNEQLMQDTAQNLYENRIKSALNNCLTSTDLPLPNKRSGKVRDTFDIGDKMILITTDRLSAFDRILAAIPFKGQALNQISAWWFEKTKHIVQNHVLSIPDPNVTVAKKCKVYPIEFVVRGYITGSTNTSAWVNYQKGVRDYCGNILPEGMRKNQQFERPIITPTTKSDEHDRLISPFEIIKEGLMTDEEWARASEKALELFAFGQKIASEHGLILVDTKYEFGKDSQGNLTLIDEIHTPDSSRYWISSSYKDRFAAGLEPENIDKEFLRLWFKENTDPYKNSDLPKAPTELVVELSKRYIMLYEMITGEKFQFPDEGISISNRIANALSDFQEKNSAITAVLILGSAKDEDHAKKITDALDSHNIKHEQHIASAHKEAAKALQILEKYKNDKVIYITIAGRSNALSGFVAGNSSKITIACPPFSDKTDMLVNIHSTLQMPSNVPVMTILEPTNAALAVKRISEL